LIKTHTRSTDIVGRYGGEEFMVILSNTTIDNCYIIAEKIRASMSAINSCGNDFKITISAGIAQFDITCRKDEFQSISNMASHLVDVADNYLYQAKESGRDKTMGFN